MKYAILTILLLVATYAHADDYNAGYNSGYYTGAVSTDPGSAYGRGVDDGAYDADEDDRQAELRRVEDAERGELIMGGE